MATRKVMENPAIQLKKHHNSPQSMTLCLLVGMGLRTMRKINPVQILHWIGLNRHSTIHLRIMEGVQGPWGPLQIPIRLVRQVCIMYTILERECTLEQTNKQS